MRKGMPRSSLRLFVGSYTQPLPHAPHANGQGVYALDFDAEHGTLSEARLAAHATNPSFLAAHPNGRSLYAASETGEGQLLAFRVGQNGDLTLLNARETEGRSPAHVSVDPEGRFVFAVNYGGTPSALAFPVKQDGALGEAAARAQHEGGGPNRERQDGPHPHSLRASPDGRHVYAMDLGTDEVVTYDHGPHNFLGRLRAAHLPSGGGPRHIAFHPHGTFAFVTLELSSAVAVLRRDPASGELTLLSSARTQSADFQGENAPAEVLVSPDGRFVYVTNRGQDNLAVFALHPDGSLEVAQHVSTEGHTPRGAALTPDGTHLIAANQDSATLAVFERDAATGQLQLAGVFACPTPTSVCFLP